MNPVRRINLGNKKYSTKEIIQHYNYLIPTILLYDKNN